MVALSVPGVRELLAFETSFKGHVTARARALSRGAGALVVASADFCAGAWLPPRGAAFARRMPLATCQSDSPIHFVCAPTCQDWIDFTRDHTEIPVFAGGYAGRNVTGACNPLACVSSVER